MSSTTVFQSAGPAALSTTQSFSETVVAPVRPKMENTMKPGDKGLAASRWATSELTPPPTLAPSPTLAPAQTKAISTTKSFEKTVVASVQPKMENIMKPGDKGLASSRWATPSPVSDPAPAPSPTLTPAKTKAISTTKSFKKTVVAPVRPKMENIMKPGDKGLAASRWATPAPATTPASKPAPAPTPAATPTKTITTTRAFKKTVVAAVLPKMENIMKPGDKGLASSRWATPSLASDPAPAAPAAPTYTPAPTPEPEPTKAISTTKAFDETVVEATRPQMENTMKPGDKGLAASRWA
ncbi:hypothetical protein B0T19DRAFT_480825 [Cercophora scortea]|uniref:Uncharacterized protein n=1 Tax=Cercophora scortea TaxID=314031 RepID=A0AAE0MKS7_9PEZI|nr:hypothetical protein B0T19DRAFT_480825 [Cercophora scortea]